MERIDIKKAQAIAKNKGLKPGKVKGTDGVQFTKGKNDRLDVITWSSRASSPRGSSRSTNPAAG